MLIGLSTAISLNEGSRLDEGLLIDLHCVHLKVSSLLSMHSMHGCMHWALVMVAHEINGHAMALLFVISVMAQGRFRKPLTGYRVTLYP